MRPSLLREPPPSNSAAPVIDGAWRPAQRFAFRAAFVYAVLFVVESLLDSGPAPRALLAALREPLVLLVGHKLLRLAGIAPVNDAAWTVAELLAAVLRALVIASIWTAVARREQYDRLYGWLSIGLRYYVGVIMLVYGGFKIIDTQFPPIPLDQLDRRLGSMAPMSLLWAYMGYSSVYSAFTGFGESLGGVLLLFRRTTTAGAVLLVTVLANVALINFVYDVPVKYLAANLLLAVMVLAAGDAQRLLDVFVFNRPVTPRDMSFPLGPAMSRLRMVVKPAVVAMAIIGPVTASFFVHRNIVRRSPLYGVYDVAPQTSAGWHRVVFSAPNVMTVASAMDSVRPFVVSVDTVGHRLTGRPRDGNAGSGVLTYERTSGTELRLHGQMDGDTVDLMLHRLNERSMYRLLR